MLRELGEEGTDMSVSMSTASEIQLIQSTFTKDDFRWVCLPSDLVIDLIYIYFR